MAEDIHAEVRATTEDWRGRVRKASVVLRGWESAFARMKRNPNVHVRLPLRPASVKLASAADISHALTEAVHTELFTIKGTSQQLVPKDTMNLHNSARVHRPRREGGKGDTVVGSVSYGNEGQADYALWVHERLELSHPNGQAKFLEAAAVEHSTYMDDRLAKWVENRLRVMLR